MVWQGSVGDRRPYADQVAMCLVLRVGYKYLLGKRVLRKFYIPRIEWRGLIAIGVRARSWGHASHYAKTVCAECVWRMRFMRSMRSAR